MNAFAVLAMLATCTLGLVLRTPEGEFHYSQEELEQGNHTTIADLQTRNAYELGVNIYTNKNCGGSIVAVRNHDLASCNDASVHSSGYQWVSFRDKTDGASKGNGCLSTFSDDACRNDPGFLPLQGKGLCLNFDYFIKYFPKCIVVSDDTNCNGQHYPTCPSANWNYY